MFWIEDFFELKASKLSESGFTELEDLQDYCIWIEDFFEWMASKLSESGFTELEDLQDYCIWD